VTLDVVDAQIHVWEEDRPDRPWDPPWAERLKWMLDGAQAPTIDRAIAAMDAVGVSGAVVTAFQLYPDAEYALEATARHPDRFRTVAYLDPTAEHPEVPVERYAELPGVVALRLAPGVAPGGFDRLRDGGYQPVFDAAGRHGLPVMLAVSGKAAACENAARANPGVQLIVDHLGLSQPHGADPAPAEPFAGLDDVLALARCPNVAIKASAVPTLSSQAYPFADLWPGLHRVLDAFGSDRVMWGSDYARCRGQHTYAEGVDYLRRTDELSEDEKALVLGRTARRIFNWSSTED
jgi:L-fuconolactonase